MFAMSRLRRAPDDDAEHWLAIAAEVTRERHARSLSQRALADLCGTTQSAIARLERGARPPRLDTLLRIAGALDCELVVRLRRRTAIGGEPA